MNCPRCRNDNPEGVRFCGECGARMDIACAACGSANSPANKFCHECGASLAASMAPKFAAPNAYTPRHLAERILTSKAALEGERKQVTVLFADLKGSMELLAGRDPEEARRVLDPVLERMMEAVHRYEGTVNQVMGDGIMALFGAPLAHEDHAVRACFAALRMQKSVRDYAAQARESAGVAIQIRVGMNSGQVVVRSIGSDLRMDYTAVGETTHLAARMEQTAAGGSILLTAATLRLVEDFIEVRALGPVPVKGLAAPLEVYEVTGGGAARYRFDASTIRGLTHFVGRRAELEHLHAALHQAGNGEGRVVALIGDPGVGKTRLVHEFTRSARAGGWLVLASSSVAYEKATPFLPLAELLKAYFQVEPGDGSLVIRDKIAGRLLALDRSFEPLLPAFLGLLGMPVEGLAWNALDPPQRHGRMLDACKRLLLRESEIQPLLVIFEDLHWIDSETQSFLDLLVDKLPGARVMLLVDFRPEYRHRWSGSGCYSELRIEPLEAVNAGALLDSLLGADPSVAPLKPLLAQKAEGNPFFLEESVRSLIETGALSGARGGCRLEKPVDAIRVPATVHAILAARIDRLPSAEKRLLQVAAVIGRDVPYGLIEALGEGDGEALRRGLALLQASEFLRETRLYPELEYSFKHALTQEVAYQGLLQDRRRALHARVMAAIEKMFPDRLAEQVEALARHALQAEAWEKAADYLQMVGDVAISRGTFADFLKYHEQALEVADRLPQNPDNARRKVNARLRLGSSLQGEIDRPMRLFAEAERLAEDLGDVRMRGQIAQAVSGRLFGDGRYAESLEEAHRALAFADSVSDPELRLRVLMTFAFIYVWKGNFGAAIEHLHPHTEGPEVELAKRMPIPFSASLYIGACALRGLCHARRGEFAAAKTYGDRATQFAETLRVPRAMAIASIYRAHATHSQGEIAAAMQLFAQAVELSEKEGMVFWVGQASIYLGRTLAELGRADEGLACTMRGIAVQEKMGTRSGRSLACAALATTLLYAGRIAEAEMEAMRALEIATATGERFGEVFALDVLGRVASASEPPDAKAAAAFYARAIAVADELGMRPHSAMMHLGLGRLFRRTGETAGRHSHLSTATAMFRELSMPDYLQLAEAEMA